ncbi:MAG: protein phosphatase 2C domain-containing protein [Chloroflexota bacterium]|nr:protein phosphatase 2C domain-containing protein [Chloroflexota bacterium]
MHVRAQAYWLPKAGNSEDEYEDAYYPETACISSASGFRCAVADGATETSFSALWARLLVRAYCCGSLSSRNLTSALLPLQREWDEHVAKRPLPWFAEQKARQGAYSALVGLSISTVRFGRRIEGRWQALAGGDSCLFQLRGERLVRAFPLSRSEEFDSRPALISSHPAANAGLQSQLRTATGRWLPGDLFYLMSDALACWFLRKLEEGLAPRPLPEEVRPEDFLEWIAELRRHGQLRNDDVTLLRVEVT